MPSYIRGSDNFDSSVGSGTLGEGQTWADYKSSRSTNTKYRNTTGRAIQVAIGFQGDFGSAQVYVSAGPTDANYIKVYDGYGDGQPAASVAVIVPDDHYYYAVSNTTMTVWAELR